MPQSLYGWSRVNAHYGITQEGVAVCINDPMDMIWHAQRLSKTTIGIEIEGNYQGLEDNPNTLWRPGGGPHTLNKKMLEAADAIFAELAFQFKRSGAEWKHVWAHRQSSASRRRDPGQEIWTHIGRDWMEALGLSSESLGRSHGTGCPIPKQWDREGEGEY
jgi:N-acetyl-anhydromuramyl-L-alanine amidase AmpD